MSRLYKVMLVDDDYPVLELLSEQIDWNKYGLALAGCYENGAEAWEGAAEGMPDILITDIGMPRMNGLELIERMKERKPDLRVAILSCHSEFQYARQAMRLNVQDYLIKDTLDLADLEKLLDQFVAGLSQEKHLSSRRDQLEHLVDRSRELLKENFIRNTLNQPLMDVEAWLKEAEGFGLKLRERSCLPVLGFIDEYRMAKKRFVDDDTLRFAVHNVIAEVVRGDERSAVHFAYGSRESFFLYPYQSSLKLNPYEEAAKQMKDIQAAVRKYLKISISFLIGDGCQEPEELKVGLQKLVASGLQRFYMEEGSVIKRKPPAESGSDLFSYYDQASKEFREMILEKKPESIVPTVDRWIAFIREKAYPEELVKDWVLKLLLDLKLKLQSMQHFRSAAAVDVLHKEISEIGSARELGKWLTEYFRSAIVLAGEISGQSKRNEVVEACQYVALHLDKKISLEEVAEHLFLNSSYFSRLFKKEMGETFIEYVTRMKMERAKELLDQTGLPIGKICEMLGYDNQSYFIKIFKTAFGVTPVEYRG